MMFTPTPYHSRELSFRLCCARKQMVRHNGRSIRAIQSGMIVTVAEMF
jgi:hypothetical protein